MRSSHSFRVSAFVSVAQGGVRIHRELGIDRQKHAAAVFSRQFDCIFHGIAAVFCSHHIAQILFRRHDLLQNCAKLNLAQNAAGFYVGKHAGKVPYARSKRLHLSKALIDLLQPFVDKPEGLRHTLFQRLLQLFIHDAAHLVQLPVVVRLHCAKAGFHRIADVFKLLFVFGCKCAKARFQRLMHVLHGLVHGFLPRRQVSFQRSAHALLVLQQHFPHAADGALCGVRKLSAQCALPFFLHGAKLCKLRAQRFFAFPFPRGAF